MGDVVKMGFDAAAKRMTLGGLLARYMSELEDHFPIDAAKIVLVNGATRHFYAASTFNAHDGGPDNADALLNRFHNALDTNTDVNSRIESVGDKHRTLLLTLGDGLSFGPEDLEDESAFLSPDLAEEIHFVLDHEIGHAIVQGGLQVMHGDANRAESAADAYALLRHYQRYGTDTGFDTNMIVTRTLHHLLHTKIEHSTTLTLGAIMDIKHMIDHDRILPVQTRELAARFASKHTAHVTLLAEITRAADMGTEEACPEKILRQFAYKTLSRELSFEATQFATAFFTRLLDDEAGVTLRRTDGEVIDLYSDEWRQARTAFTRLAFVLNRDDVMTGMPVVSSCIDMESRYGDAAPKRAIHTVAHIG